MPLERARVRLSRPHDVQTFVEGFAPFALLADGRRRGTFQLLTGELANDALDELRDGAA